MFPEAFDRLIAHVRDKAAKDRLLEYFDIVGPEDPSGSAARRKMASALF
jgi:thioredoxin-like negative regulator of GroEL